MCAVADFFGKVPIKFGSSILETATVDGDATPIADTTPVNCQATERAIHERPGDASADPNESKLDKHATIILAMP